MIKITLKDGSIKDTYSDSDDYTMKEEIEEFIKCIENNKTESSINTHQRTIDTLKVLDEIRNQVGVQFND